MCYLVSVRKLRYKSCPQYKVKFFLLLKLIVSPKKLIISLKFRLSHPGEISDFTGQVS
jgi:hypothetical protein